MHQHLNIFESWRIKTTFTNIKYEAAEEATKEGEWPELLGRTQRKLADGMLTSSGARGDGVPAITAKSSAVCFAGSPRARLTRVSIQSVRENMPAGHGGVPCHAHTHTHAHAQCFRGNRLVKAALDAALYEWKTTASFFYLHANKCYRNSFVSMHTWALWLTAKLILKTCFDFFLKKKE